MDEIQADFLDIKLKYIDKENQRRREIAQYYVDKIRNSNIILPQIRPGTTYPKGSSDRQLVFSSHVFHLFVIRTSQRDRLQQYLFEHGIETQIHYPIPPHKQECYKELNNLRLPITEKIHAEELSLPINAAMSSDEVEKVIKIVNSYFPGEN